MVAQPPDELTPHLKPQAFSSGNDVSLPFDGDDYVAAGEVPEAGSAAIGHGFVRGLGLDGKGFVVGPRLGDLRLAFAG